MAGIYIHIPFCRKACHYCNFHFSTSFRLKDEMVNAIIKELDIQKDYLGGRLIETIYFGGGTPSAIAPEDIDKILKTITRLFKVDSGSEITLEANPEDINPASLFSWKQSGINRLSIGVQGFQDEMLKAWNRVHDARHGLQSLVMAKAEGFQNISADLIYGDPKLTDEAWIENIMELIDLGIPHLSCYALTVETGTALFHQIQKGSVKPLDEEQSHRQYTLLQQITRTNGYDQYEISNFALPGYYSKHNTSYWTGEPYLGVGPAAHSFNGKQRQWNIANNARYINSILHDDLLSETEDLTSSQRFNEWVMTGLRTARGIEVEEIKKLGENFLDYLKKEIQPYIDKGQISINDLGNYTLSPDQYFFADGIASNLFMEHKKV